MTKTIFGYALAHELGHIVCGHLKNGVCNKSDMSEELEANEFAHYLLHPGKTIKTKRWARNHKVIVLITAVILAAAIIMVPVLHFVSLQKSYYGEYYVSETGEKYHRKECLTIKGKNNVHRLTKEEFESEDYAPCQICLPDAD